MDSDNSWQIFKETGDPLAYVLYRARGRMEAGEEIVGNGLIRSDISHESKILLNLYCGTD